MAHSAKRLPQKHTHKQIGMLAPICNPSNGEEESRDLWAILNR